VDIAFIKPIKALSQLLSPLLTEDQRLSASTGKETWRHTSNPGHFQSAVGLVWLVCAVDCLGSFGRWLCWERLWRRSEFITLLGNCLHLKFGRKMFEMWEGFFLRSATSVMQDINGKRTLATPSPSQENTASRHWDAFRIHSRNLFRTNSRWWSQSSRVSQVSL